ncbi:glycosyltransferase family 4 protein [Haloarchaeobius iranensis]|uniref:Glycosyltransferase involved in cell wall bisynthesis n=1 Tax=Haloarchaeobius iranensis TaxID=996166 RepID=A0A1H0BUU5_9EURY|nr:glycosyltransferase family 1 protein [Haloarchaeobius iranensis]SDN49401.1 Glycosyltransferase involved in cell wall bisynthesis [Haloarchaeobius iranensis]
MTTIVAVNCRVLSKPTLTGVGRYTLQLLDSLVTRDDGLEYVAFGIDELPELLQGRDGIESAREPAWSPSGPVAHAWEQFRLPLALRQHEVDLLHTPAGHAPALSRLPKVTTIHDISPIAHPEWFSTGYATLYRILTPVTVRTSDALITVSESAATDIRDRYPSTSVHAVQNGVARVPNGERPTEFDVPETYFLFVGSLNPRKNISGLLRAYRKYRDNTEEPAALLLVGPENDVFADVGVDPVPGAHTTGYVSDSELGWLYRHARGFVFPSLYEGFGLPIVEAMSVGTPVITAEYGAMAETANDAAILVDPEDEAALADALLELDTDSSHREALAACGRERAEKFTWERAAGETTRIYESVHS